MKPLGRDLSLLTKRFSFDTTLRIHPLLHGCEPSDPAIEEALNDVPLDRTCCGWSTTCCSTCA